MLVSNRAYTSQTQRPAPTCTTCGRKLGVGFYFTCHVCGRTYCYAHIPVKCAHLLPGQTASSGIRR